MSVGLDDTQSGDSYYEDYLPGNAESDILPADTLDPGNAFFSLEINVSAINMEDISGENIQDDSGFEAEHTDYISIYTN